MQRMCSGRTVSREPALNSSSTHRSTPPASSYCLRHWSVVIACMLGASVCGRGSLLSGVGPCRTTLCEDSWPETWFCS